MSDTPPPPSDGEPTQPFGAGQTPSGGSWSSPEPPPATTPYSQPYGQAQPGQPPYGAPQYAGQYGGYGPAAPDHPQATTVLVLGILGLVVCQVLAPFAWVMGNRVVREIDASSGRVGGRGNAQAGRICGIVGSVLLGLSVLILGFFLVLAVGTAATGV